MKNDAVIIYGFMCLCVGLQDSQRKKQRMQALLSNSDLGLMHSFWMQLDKTLVYSTVYSKTSPDLDEVYYHVFQNTAEVRLWFPLSYVNDVINTHKTFIY